MLCLNEGKNLILLMLTKLFQIADFGLSSPFTFDGYLTTFCGSPLYAAPEIVTGTPYHGPEVTLRPFSRKQTVRSFLIHRSEIAPPVACEEDSFGDSLRYSFLNDKPNPTAFPKVFLGFPHLP